MVPNYIIADRRDLFGGRLIPMLNGIRIARSIGAKFLMTWYSDDSPFQSLVAELQDIFTGELTEPFDPSTGNGTIIDATDPLLASGPGGVTILTCEHSDVAGISDLLVKPEFSDTAGRAYILNRRFSLYSLSELDTVTSIVSDLSRIFHGLAKSPEITEALSYIDRALGSHRFAGVHVRRLHLLADTGMQVNRFDSYCDTSFCSNLIRTLINEGYDAVLIASDCGPVVADLKATHGTNVLSVEDIIELNKYRGLQRAVIDMYFLSKASTIFGPISAYGVAAAIIGCGSFREILRHVARSDIPGNDVTGAVKFLRKPNAERRSLTHTVVSSNNAALLMRAASALLLEQQPPSECLTMALRALALRLSGYRHQSFIGDWQHFVQTAYAAALKLRRGDLTEVVEALGRALTEKTIDGFRLPFAYFIQAAGGDEASRLLALIWYIVAGDLEQIAGIDYLGIAATIAASLGLDTRGILLRAAARHRLAGQQADEIQALEAAVRADPIYADSHHALAGALDRAGRVEEAKEQHLLATELEPASGSFWFELGQFLMQHGLREDGLDSLRQAVNCEPQNIVFAKTLKEAAGFA
jgi:tetratricopeptide (TPR) repeat protein